MAKLVDARDLKSLGLWLCGFDPRRPHHRAGLVGACLALSSPAMAQGFVQDIQRVAAPETIAALPKFSLRASESVLWESNPASLPHGARGYWSISTTVGADAELTLAPGVTLNAGAQNRFWRYPAKSAWHSNDASANAALTAKVGAFNIGARAAHFGSYDPGFRDKIELRDDVGVFAARPVTIENWGLTLTPGLSLSRRIADNPALDRWRVSANLLAVRKIGALSLGAQLAVSHDEFLHRVAGRTRRDLGGLAEVSMVYTLSKQVETGFEIQIERYASSVDGAGYSALTVLPRALLRLAF